MVISISFILDEYVIDKKYIKILANTNQLHN